MQNKATPEDFKIYHIFLASPGDMSEERQMVREFFDRYNRNAANPHRLEFKVIDWENYSSIGLGRPQELITRQTLEKFKNSLILFIGLLGQRFGTPTGGYDSGTEEEFETALDFRATHGEYPEIKWFFREQWGNAGLSTDPEIMTKAIQQLEKVKAFKARLQTDEPQCFTANFEKTEQFLKTFQPDLERWLNDPDRPWRQRPAQPQTTPSIPETPYLDIWFKLLADECAHLPLEILEAKQGQEQADPIGLPDIFVPLKAIAPPKIWHESREQDKLLARELATGDTGKPEPIIELLAAQRLSVLIGDPGSGKSALVNQLTWLLLNGDKKHLSKPLQTRIPVRIILRRVDIPSNANKGQAAWLWNALAKDIREKLASHHLTDQQENAVATALRQKLMQPPYGLIMLDGLDEVPAANQRRSLLLQAIRALVTELPDSTYFIITARPYAYTDPRWRLNGFSAFFLTPFDQAQRAQFINGWYQAARNRFMLQNADLKQRIPDLIERVETQPHLTELAERPLLLTLISILHAGGGRLPEDRAQLYKNSVDLLLYHWRREAFRNDDGQVLRIDEGLLHRCLQTLAFKCHQAQCGQQDTRHTADISEAEIVEAFDPLLRKLGRDDLLGFLQQHTGILIAREQNLFAFPHRSFQEYLAMGYLTAGHEDDVLSPQVCADPLWWREVFLLAVIEQKQRNLRFAGSYIRDLLNCGKQQSDDNKNRLYILSALAINELDLKTSNELTVEVREGLKNLIQTPNALNVSERAEAGRALAAIGDKREGIGLTELGLPDIKWIAIPKGEVKLEDNKGSFPVDAFYLAKYPVTNAQFQRFIDEDGYADPRWWQGLDANPGTPAPPHWPEANHPRESVSWFEAMAFCAWLSERLGLAITLPAEWQWQQAACSGRADFDYPWGQDYQSGAANIDETWGEVGAHYLQRTAAVGLYPPGDSLQGVADLIGNVWEWCLNAYEQPANRQASGSLARVVRGGSWIFNQGFARASCRSDLTPGSRFDVLGFRVCCLSPLN